MQEEGTVLNEECSVNVLHILIKRYIPATVYVYMTVQGYIRQGLAYYFGDECSDGEIVL